MDLISNFALLVSGGLIVGSILLSKIGFERRVLSKRAASGIAAVGVGVGGGIFIFFGVGAGDLGESIYVGTVAAIVTGFICLIFLYK
jgi:hypothetical protein